MSINISINTNVKVNINTSISIDESISMNIQARARKGKKDLVRHLRNRYSMSHPQHLSAQDKTRDNDKALENK